MPSKQKGGFLPALAVAAPIVAPLIGDLISTIFNKLKGNGIHVTKASIRPYVMGMRGSGLSHAKIIDAVIAKLLADIATKSKKLKKNLKEKKEK